MPPKGVDWAEEAAGMAEVLSRRRAGDSSGFRPVGGQADPDEATSQLRRRLRSFWNCYGAGFSEWWLALPEADRTPFLRTAVPFLPAKRGDTSVRVPGAAREEDCSGSSLFTPELNVADLTADGGRGLLSLFEQRVQQARHADAVAAEGRRQLIVDDLDERDGQWMERLLRQGLVPPLPGGPPPGSFVLELGQGLKVYTPAADPAAQRQVAELRAKLGAAAMDAQAYFLMRQRQVSLLSALLVWGDSYRCDVLGREGKAFSLKAAGCSQCGSHSGKGGKDLLFCPCGWAVYCS
ncbi:hypothetical protein ABPG75_005090 [Micractinium tetrahymenae]